MLTYKFSKKVTALVLTVVVSTSCAPTVTRTDYDLQWDKYTARLVVVDENGKLIPAFDGKYVALPGFVFSGGQIRMHPGKQHIGHICPTKPGDVYVTDIAPSVVYNFEAGKRYELACVGNYPKIQESRSEQTQPERP